MGRVKILLAQLLEEQDSKAQDVLAIGIGVPDQVEEVIVYYNKDLFNKLGFNKPKSVDELRKIADELKGRGKIPLAFGDKEQ